ILFQNSDGTLDGQTFDGEPDIFFDGTFSIFSNRFDLFVDGWVTSTAISDPCTGDDATVRYIWDFTGTMNGMDPTP
ncbi:MAG: hypothetical protein AAF709_07935, partial [Pseudomonadota bacterium]